MKKILISLCLLMVSLGTFAQDAIHDLKESFSKDNSSVYEVVDVDEVPHFTGGIPALNSYLSNNVKYPVVAQENIVAGRVTVSFIVKSDGSIADAKVVRSTAASQLSYLPGFEQKMNNGKEALSEEALRVVSSMPKWVPGKLNGKNVCVKYNMPITFKLQTMQEEEPKKDTIDTLHTKPNNGTFGGVLKIREQTIPEEEPKKDTTDTLYTKPYDGTFGEVLKIREVADQPSNINTVSGSNKLSDIVDEMPQFPGGTNGLMVWLSNNVKYPAVAQENGVQGRVIVSCVIERDGSITDVRVVQGIDPSLDKEAVRVVSSMPKWTPAKIKGQPIRVLYRVPVAFRLQ